MSALLVLGIANCGADEPAEPVTTVERVNLSTGGTGLYRPEKWGLIKVSLRNPHDREIELLATTHFENDDTLQYGRRFWMPPQSRMVTWHPLKMPRLEKPDQKFFNLRSMVLSATAQGETSAANELGATQFDQGFRVAADEMSTAIVIDEIPGSVPSPLWADAQEFVLTARFDRGLKYNFTLLIDPLFPAGEELLDVLDHLVIAGDQYAADAAGIAAIRRWVAAGGRLWIMADRISPKTLAALLGDEDTVVEVDRVDLTTVHIESTTLSLGDDSFTRDLERPVKFVRLYADGMDVDFKVNGWPAAFHRPYGSGRILVTTLGSDGWLRPRLPGDLVAPSGRNFQTQFTPSSELSKIALDFFTPRSGLTIPRDIAEEQVQQLIGYSVPSRGLVLGTLAAFTVLMLVVSIGLGKAGRLEIAGLLIPGLAVVAAGVMLVAGWSSRSTIPTTTSIVQTVHVVPGTSDIRTSGVIGAFAREAQDAAFAGRQGGWMSPEMAGLEGSTRRLVWTDIDCWNWEHLQLKPGVRTVTFQTGGKIEQPIDLTARFDEQGISGTLHLPADVEPSDGLIVTSNGRLGVELAADGKFRARSTAVLEDGEYLSAGVLTDEQQRRSQMLARALGSGKSDQIISPRLLVWTKPWSAGLSLVDPRTTAGSALMVIPLEYDRPAPGTAITLSNPFLPFREVAGPDGLRPTGVYDIRTRKWVERTGPVAAWLAFMLPEDLLPLDIKSARLTIKVLGPIGHVEISAMENGRLHALKTWESPVGTLTHEITDPAALKLDSRGRLLLRIDAGRQAADVDANSVVKNASTNRLGVGDPASYWQFEDVSLELSAEGAKTFASTQP
jgi:hypothetical protein